MNLFEQKHLQLLDSTKPNQLDQSYKHEEILKELRREIINIQHTKGRKKGRKKGGKVERRKANCTGHSLHRNCLLKHVSEGRIRMTRRRGRRGKQLLSSFKDTRGYWKLKEETLDGTLWRIRFLKRLWICCRTDKVTRTRMTSLKIIRKRRVFLPRF
jgi:hypothetical protein